MNKIILFTQISDKKTIIRLFIGFSILFVIASCTIQLPGKTSNEGTEQTQQAINVQQTILAQQSEQQMQGTIQAQQATIAAQSALATSQAQSSSPSADIVATQVAQSSQSPPQTQPAQPSPPPPTTNSGEIPDNFDEMIKSANIVLYEDMITERNTLRYVKAALDNLGLNYKDDGNAKGWFKADLLNGTKDGKPWDLVIMASESKSGMSGEFFDYLNQVLNKGSSVIIETWYLDSVANGKASLITSRCGFAYQKDWVMVLPENMAMYPLDSENPILHNPNDGLTFSDILNYWAYDDIGDLIKLTGKGDAKLLLGTKPTEKDKYGTLVVCLDGKLIWQTFCSHNLSYDEMVPVWENYIYNSLKARFME